ncbi:DUF2306 domain-containing protein [Telluribacter sp. SYSU D00476]|uniref:DUF2306 domain-containing protein n=1 Tax=Telluribacter sp. SYSU D00476 TaxID=2811430 RepID=UPI001FF10921|nr:DUF2306 domain-containing protein [Telluribacter sp. SYSU D00476]
MAPLFGDTYGLIHLLSSLMALVTGTMVLVMRKGTRQHRQIGYGYVVSMGVLILTAFMIYRLYNGWGVFHYTTVAILITIGSGLVPIWLKKPVGRWQYRHFSFMYWSVIGLYSAFAAEVLTRVPQAPFFGMVGLAFGVIMFAGGIIFAMNRLKWAKLFRKERT